MNDPLDGDWDPTANWSTSNVGEAVPGVLTPLNWSLWKHGGEVGLRAALTAVGTLDRSQAAVPASDRDRIIALFHGRLAANRDALERKASGRSSLAVSQPKAAVLAPSAVRRLHSQVGPWWSSQIARSGRLDRDGARAQWQLAADRFSAALSTHITCVFAAVQPAHDGVVRLCASAGRPDLTQRLTAGLGNHAEITVVHDLWEVSRERLSFDMFLAMHGYHGHDEGEIASHVWRENPHALDQLVERYRELTESPDDIVAARTHDREAAERELLAALPSWQRGPARALLGVAARVIPLRGVGKVSFLRVLDVARAAARRNGELLAAAGHLAAADDVFLLTAEEMLVDAPRHDLVARRRAQRVAHHGVVLPTAWRGRPSVVPLTSGGAVSTGTVLNGVGVSAGLVEARARVLTGAGDLEFEAGEILVAPYTDPSWGPLMFTAGALVVDNGGERSHAAVVARELGVPCVMATGNGTRRLRTGDRLRVDGASGTVEVLGVAA